MIYIYNAYVFWYIFTYIYFTSDNHGDGTAAIDKIPGYGICETAVKLEFESLIQAVKHENGETWSRNVDFGPKLYIIYSVVTV